MARDEVQLTPEEQLIVGQLEGLDNNTVIYKDNAGVYQDVALGVAGTVLQSNGATSAPSFAAVGTGDMVLASVQSVTGLKTFDKDKLAMKGTSTGTTTVSTANTGATNYTQTMQARNGTIANLDNETYIGTTAVALNRTSAALTLAGITLTTPDIGTPSAGVLTNCTYNVGNADTTITRVSAGVIAVEGVTVPTISSSNTLTNKTINLANNTLSGTKAQFDTAVSDGNICYDGDSVTNLNMNTGKLLGRNTASAGAVEEITVGTGLSFSGTTLNASGGSQKLRTTIPGEIIADANNYQGLYFKNESGATWTISNVAVAVGINASGVGAACAINLYKSSGTESDGINTNATALFTIAVDLGTAYSDLSNTPDTTTVEDGRWLSVRVTSSAGATRKASDMQVIITYT